MMTSTMTKTEILDRLRGGLIASAQAYPGEPMRDPRTMDEVAQACVAGGAVGIRAQGLADLALITQHVDVPVIGLWKDGHDGVFITPTLTHARGRGCHRLPDRGDGRHPQAPP